MDEQRGLFVQFASGGIFRTDDGGMNWDVLWAPAVSGNLYDVEYVTADTMLVCGSNGGLFRSTDGGNSWHDLNPPTIEWLYQLHFLNSQIGFAIGFNGVIIRTMDGGTNWQVIPSGTTNRLWGITFTDENTGYICGWSGTILKTTNAGLTWSALSSGSTASFQDVTFVDSQIGFVCGSNGTILKTSNGGTSWTQQITGGSNTLNTIHFRSATHGWAGGGFGIYYSTTNGGTSWTTSTQGSNDILCGQYVSSNAAFLMGARQISKSTNNGSSWTVIKNAVTNSRFNAITFQSDLVGTAVGSVGVLGEGNNQTGIVQTTDGGQTWQIRNQGSGGGWYAVHFPTNNIGFVAGASGFGKTTNGGTNWTYSSPFTSSPLCMWFTSEQNGNVGTTLGSTGICHTSNSGASFTCGTNQPASAMQFTSANVGYAVHSGMAMTFFKTTDGGVTWTNMPGMQGSNMSMHFISDDEGWVGSIGSVWHTTDGGLNWTEAFSGSAAGVAGIHFYSPTLGYIVDSEGNIFRSTDAGATWNQLNIGNIPVIQASFTENYCYASSYAGSIFRAELGCGAFQAGNITGDQQWCEGYTNNLVVDMVLDAVSYEWTLPPGWTGATNNWLIQPVASDQSGLVSVTITNACGFQSTVSYDIDVIELVEEPVIVGPSSLCDGSSVSYTVEEDINATSYDWSVTVGPFTENGSSVVTINDAQQSGLVYVRSSNECSVSDWVSMNVGLVAAPTVTFNPNDVSFCAGDVVTLNGGAPTGGVYSGTGVNNGVFDASTLGEGNYSITYNYELSPGCGGSATSIFEVYTTIESEANFNGDCDVDEADLDLLISQFGCLGNCSADLDNNGVVGTEDLMIFMGMLTD